MNLRTPLAFVDVKEWTATAWQHRTHQCLLWRPTHSPAKTSLFYNQIASPEDMQASSCAQKAVLRFIDDGWTVIK